MKHIHQIQNLIQTIESHIPNADLENTDISKSNIAWHLDHSLKVINGISGALKTSDVKDYKWKFNKLRFMCFTLNRIPRGKGKAPKRVLPPEVISTDAIKEQIATAKTQVEALKEVPKLSNFSHPVFGCLNKKQTLKFIQLHTNHHLKIVNDILKK